MYFTTIKKNNKQEGTIFPRTGLMASLGLNFLICKMEEILQIAVDPPYSLSLRIERSRHPFF